MSEPVRGLAVLAVSLLVLAGCGTSVPSSDEGADPGPDDTATVTSTSDGADGVGESGGTGVVDEDVLDDLAAVPLDAIVAAYEANPSENPVMSIDDGTPLQEDGKPEVLYVGAEFCPFCAAERWALTVALSKFGQFTDLAMLTSSGRDVPTVSYVGSTYTSDHVAFSPVELQDQDGQPLEDATDAQMDLFRSLGEGSFPFIDFAGLAFQKGGSVEVGVLLGESQADIAAALAESTTDDTDPDTIPGSVNAVAGEFIVTICEATGGEPGEICDAFG